MRLKAILLDKDGTLIDFDRTWGPAAYEVMRALARGDRGRLEAVMRASHYLEAERRFLPTSPLVAGSSAHYGPLWAAALGRPPGPALYGEMDELFMRHGLASLSPIGDPAGIHDDDIRRALPTGVAKVNVDTDLRLALTVGLREILINTPKEFDPRKILGKGRDYMAQIVAEKLELMGAAGKA